MSRISVFATVNQPSAFRAAIPASQTAAATDFFSAEVISRRKVYLCSRAEKKIIIKPDIFLAPG